MDKQNTTDRASSFDRQSEVIERWAIELTSGANLRHLGDVWGIRDVLVLDSDDAIWLRGDSISSETWTLLSAIPDAVHYRVLTDEQLARVGRIVPSNRLPPGNWIPLSDWLKIELPPIRFAGDIVQQLPIRLVRSAKNQQANLMMCDFDAWSDYALTAAQVRLRPLRFACSAKGRALIHGEPLPPIRGILWYEADGVAIPCGYRWEPNVDVAVLKQSLIRRMAAEARSALFLLHSVNSKEDSVSLEVITEYDLTPATYAAIRATQVNLASTSGGDDE